MIHSNKVIIIGSGVAGLAASVRLAVLGYDVSVYEANSFPGGKISLLEKSGYQFDTGPSLFTQPENISELFEIAGEPIEEYFSYSPVDIACKYFFENGKVITAYTEPELFAEELSKVAGEKKEYAVQYLSRSRKLYEHIGNIFLNYSLHKRSTWINRRIFKAIGNLKWPYLFSTLNNYNKKSFQSEEAVQIFNRYATYNGSNPFRAPGMLSVIPHLEHNQGTYFPKGGMISIADALYKLALKKGVQFHFNKPVSRIIQSEGIVKGVVVEGKNVFAPLVISNCDVYFTFKKLLNHIPASKKILERERSTSAVIFYWGIGKSFEQLGLHNILFSKNYKEEFSSLSKGIIHNDPTIYINITSKLEQQHAPHGKENWFVMVNAPANDGQDWSEIIQRLRLDVIRKINTVLETDLEKLIETEEVLDPIQIEDKTASFKGSLYGTSSNSKLAAFFRHPNFTKYIKGLYFCGGSVHPGGGIPLCFKSAKIASELIATDFPIIK